MNWHDLLFAHWPLRAGAVRPLVPAGLALDTFDGAAWVSIAAFRMSGVRPRGVPALPYFSAFPELNVRTYVTAGGKPGVWFFSLDAANAFAVWMARRWYRLPYFRARMALRHAGACVEYSSTRARSGAPPGEFRARCRPTGEAYRAAEGSLDEWLVERYCLYAAGTAGRIFRGEIHHAPWPLQPAEAQIEANTMLAAAGLPEPTAAPLAHFARRLDVLAWPLAPV